MNTLTSAYMHQLAKICDKIKNELDSNNLKQLIQQLYQVLNLSNKQSVEFNEQQLLQIKQCMQQAFTSIVDNDILSRQQITKPTAILDKVDIIDVNFNDSKIASKVLNVGLVALLMSCSTMFADVVKNQSALTVDSVRLLKNSSDDRVANLAMPLLKYFQGTVKGNIYDSNGNIIHQNVHIVYDDNKGLYRATPWDGKSDLSQFIKSCHGKSTIGYGVTNKKIVAKGFLTDDQAQSFLRTELMWRIKQYKNYVGQQVIQSLTYIQQACLMVLWYNLPPYKTPSCVKYLRYAYNPQLDNSSKKLTRNEYLRLAANEFLDCNKSGGKVSKGLTIKVNHLYKLFVRGIK